MTLISTSPAKRSELMNFVSWSSWGIFDVDEDLDLDGGHCKYEVNQGDVILARHNVDDPLQLQGLPIYNTESVKNDHVNTILYYLEHADIDRADLLVDGGILPGLAKALVVVNDIYLSHGMNPPFITTLLSPYANDLARRRSHSFKSKPEHLRAASAHSTLMVGPKQPPSFTFRPGHSRPQSFVSMCRKQARKASTIVRDILKSATCGILTGKDGVRVTTTNLEDGWVVVPGPSGRTSVPSSVSTATSSSVSAYDSSASLLYPPTASVRRAYGAISPAMTTPSMTSRSCSPQHLVLSPRTQQLPKLRIKHHRSTSSSSSIPISPVMQTRSRLAPKPRIMDCNQNTVTGGEREPLLRLSNTGGEPTLLVVAE